MKRVILLNPPSDKLVLRDNYCCSTSKATYYWPPTDLLVQSAVLKNDFECVLIDSIINQYSVEHSLKLIQSVDNCGWILSLSGTTTWKEDFEFFKEIKLRMPDIRIIGSGGFLLYNIDKALGNGLPLDAILMDFTTHETIPLFKGERAKSFSQIVYFEGGKVHLNTGIKNNQYRIGVPQHHLFLKNPYRIPFMKGSLLSSVQTSYGCPYPCNFCISGTIPYKLREKGEIIDEFQILEQLGVSDIWFADFTFTCNRKHVMEILSIMEDRQFKFNWTCQTRVDSIDDELLENMKKAGCNTILFGVETGSESVLKETTKKTTLEEVEKAFAMCRKAKIKTLAFFIIGLPSETPETVQQTINFALKIKPDYVSFSLATPDMGTSLRKDLLDSGIINDETDSFDSTLAPVFDTKGLPTEQISSYIDEAYRRFYLRPGYLLRRIIDIRSFQEFKMNIQEGITILRHILS